KNPPPACLSTPIPYLPSIDLCILFYNIFTPGRNIHMCVNFLTRVEHAEVFVMEFDCFKIGVDGFMTYKPEENAGISTEGPDEEEFTTDDYDEIIECTPGYSPDSTNETETTTLVECMTRPTTPVMENVTHVTQMDMITPASWSSGWCFYFWCSSNTTTTTPTPILNEEYPPTANSSMGSNGNSSWCWYFWCNSTNDVPPSAPPTNGSANGNGSTNGNGTSSMASNWCFYFWCDDKKPGASNGTSVPSKPKPPMASGTVGSSEKPSGTASSPDKPSGTVGLPDKPSGMGSSPEDFNNSLQQMGHYPSKPTPTQSSSNTPSVPSHNASYPSTTLPLAHEL
ncbi:uncharacterized protein LOC103518396, partial [Diaphorina citri]|uniref:Uncharacterized protein LOC103518396 n=1 Tax=Diaphorina citri TaxID=121845 RepID=A0A3Q0JBW7_DIACI